MRGDTDYANQHQHGVKESAQAASGNHLMLRSKPTEQKEIRRVSSSFRGHLLLTFVDGTAYELQREDYPHNVPPKAGEFYPPLSIEQQDAQAIRENALAGQSLDEAEKAAEPAKPKRKKKAAEPVDNA